MAVTEVNRSGGACRRQAPTQPAVPFAVAFDIGVDIPGRLFVRGRGLDSEWNGKLSLKGDLADPLIEGELDVRRGHFDLLDRRFTIDRGALDFVGSRPPVPMIDLAATATTVEVNVTVAPAGAGARPQGDAHQRARPAPGRDPRRACCSAPRPRGSRRCRACASPLRSRSCRAAASSAARSPSSGARSGVDTLDLQSTETTDAEGETNQQTSARVGKYVTDKVYLEVEQRRHRRRQQGPRPGRPHPQPVGRQHRQRPVADRRRPAMALRLLSLAGCVRPAIGC